MFSRESLKGIEPWAIPQDKAFEIFFASASGISEHDAERRQHVFGKNELAPKKKRNALLLFFSYFINPLMALLITVAIASYLMNNVLSAIIVAGMVLVSVSLSFYQEYTARNDAEKLRKMIRNTATVVRDGSSREIPLKFLVPGDIIRLSAGDLVPADCRIITCKDFFVNQASLTGESLPVEKFSNPSPYKCTVQQKHNAVFLGSSVVSGSAEAMVVKTGLDTQFGEISRQLSMSAPETAFDRGIREYSSLMVKFVIVLVVAIFLINLFTKNDVMSAILFSLAVAVGLAPEMLPVIVTANLAQGAKNMAKKEAIVKRLPSIQNLSPQSRTLAQWMSCALTRQARSPRTG
ncbi:MAG: HAD-IC family P-type ATPase [Candidatus Micrarchaeota archaeon]|nr:HAD-IC family P-type ATPase [Candidatus Micrarchaeota archaeon]